MTTQGTEDHAVSSTEFSNPVIRSILSRFGAAYYFLHFLVVLPLVGRLETPLPLPTSISQPVLRTNEGGAQPSDLTMGGGFR